MNPSDLHQRRLRLGLSREQIAQAVGVDERTISAWEEGAETIRCPRALEQILKQRENDLMRHAGRNVA